MSLEQAAAAYVGARARVDEAKAAVTAAQVDAERARLALAAAVVAEYQTGVRQAEVARRAGLARETVRRYLRAAGIAADE